jgi:hypothetical protein
MEHFWSRAVATRGNRWQWQPVAKEETPKPTESGKNLSSSVALALKWSGGETPLMRTAHQSRPPIPPQSAFAGFRFPSDVIVVAVRWYLRFGLSYRDVEELLAGRGVEVDHVTIYRWVLRFTPLLAEAARPCRHASAGAGSLTRPTSESLTAGAMSTAPSTNSGRSSMYASPRRDGKAARRFFEKPSGRPGSLPMKS